MAFHFRNAHLRATVAPYAWQFLPGPKNDASRNEQENNVMKMFLASLIALGVALISPAMAQDGYSVRAGDVLKIEVLEDPTLNRSVLVAPDGRITLPLAGSIRASGQSIDAIAASISAGLGPSFAAAPTVVVSLERLAERRNNSGNGGGAAARPPTISVYVIGEAGKPGKFDIAPGSTVLQLFAEMGGFSKFAATKRLQLRRGETTFALNYDEIETGASNAGSTTLKPGDVLIIPQRRLFE
jgi:polysaccharide biosynthesis/export protein